MGKRITAKTQNGLYKSESTAAWLKIRLCDVFLRRIFTAETSKTTVNSRNIYTKIIFDMDFF